MFFLEATIILLLVIYVFYVYFWFNCPKYKKELRFNVIILLLPQSNLSEEYHSY